VHRSARDQFADRLREVLAQAGLSQAVLARKLRAAGFERVGEPRVSEWCHGRALPRDETVILAIQSLAAAAGAAVSGGELVALYWAARGQVGSPRGQAPVPRELPTRLRRFTGRDAELAHLRRLLDNQTAGGAQIVVVHGLAGVGKSALGLEVAWRLEDRFPDGQLYLELHGATAGLTPLDPGDALGRLLRSLGVDGAAIPAEPEEASARYRSLLAERQVLVVLDNAASAAQVRPLLPSSSGSAALVTSRNLLPDLDAHAVHLEVMAPQDATLLLGRIAGPQRAAGDPAAASIAELCGYLPLALRIAGARLAARPGWPLAALADRLRDGRRRLDELQIGDLAVRASFQVSYATLAGGGPVEQRAARLFRFLGLLATPDLSVAMVVALAEEPRIAVEAMLELLVDAQLLETSVPGRYRMHDLLRLFAQELVDQEESEASRAAALERVMAWQLATTRLAVRLAYPGDQWRAVGDLTGGTALQDQADAFAWLEVERSNLLAIGRQAATSHPAATMVSPLAAALFRYLQMGGYWTDLRTLNEIALQVARDAGDRSDEAQTLSDLATASWWLGEFDHAVAYNQLSLGLRRALGDRRGESLALGNLSEDYRALGRVGEALAYQRQSLAIIRELGDRPAEARSLNGMGLLSEAGGRFQEAAVWYEQALALLREVGDRAGEGGVLGNLAEVCVRGGDPQHAVRWAEDAAMVCREAGNRQGEASALRWLGAALEALGDLGRARAAWQAALALYTVLDLPEAEELRRLLDEAGVGAG
jgi:tetratricopeptide (TPR) repeat protein/transcriptional regulator with XRE-family HTH domain